MPANSKDLLLLKFTMNSPPDIFMYVALDSEHPNHGIMVGKINSPYLWGACEGRPLQTEILILDKLNNILYSSFSGLTSLPANHFKEMTESHSGQFEWRHDNKVYFSSYSSIFLTPNFFTPAWVVVLTESDEKVLAPMANFNKSFPVLIIISLGLVFFLSMILIRKNMGPIEILREATRMIAQGAFGHKVVIKSGDEFESLGNAFNEMSEKLKEGQTLLVQTGKMSVMGQMAAGVMHEISQPLTAILGLLQISLARLAREESTEEKKKRMKIIIEEVKRLNAMLRKFKSFSRMSREVEENISVVELIDRVYEMFEHEFRIKDIQCIIENEENLPAIHGDKDGLQQVFYNLLINAVHALENKKDNQRMINIKTYRSENKISVEVRDNGCGIPKGVQRSIFDPFFTTKDSEKGTGLGMAIVESILHKHNASITFDSKVGVGTKFTIVFPGLHHKEMS